MKLPKVKTRDGRTITAEKFMQEVKAAILAEPRAYSQNTFCTTPNCGTPGCIAGWMAALLPKRPRTMIGVHRRVFGFSDSPWLFAWGFRWGVRSGRSMAHIRLGDAYAKAYLQDQHSIMAKIAARAIDAYMKELKARKA